jgi:hypothetical protein
MISRSILTAAIVALTLSGCTESMSRTNHDVAEARDAAAKSNDEARMDTSREVAEANEQFDSVWQAQSESDREARRKMIEVESIAMIAKATTDFNLTMTEAMSRHQVAKGKCDALNRADEEACVSSINASLIADQSLAKFDRDTALVAAEYH